MGTMQLSVMMLIVLTAVAILVLVLLFTWYQWRKRKMEKREVQQLVEDIISEFLSVYVCRASCVRVVRELIEERMPGVRCDVRCILPATCDAV